MIEQRDKSKINLACGNVYINGDQWINLDYNPRDSSVHQADLLGKLPLKDNNADLVYCSHFLEHIPRKLVTSFLAECYRVLEPGGIIRLVLPDLENMCRNYLLYRDSAEHEKADFLVLEIVDQCVRMDSGGELGRFYRHIKSNLHANKKMADFILGRNGENLYETSSIDSTIFSKVKLNRIASVGISRLKRKWIKIILGLLPSAFRVQNVCLAAVGERHHWLWDFYQLRQKLEKVGFINVKRCNATESYFIDFPYEKLDLDTNGRPRKGTESMYIEAMKPRAH
jgi:predicted SAM-dependent methyltransferase